MNEHRRKTNEPKERARGAATWKHFSSENEYTALNK